MLPTQPSLKDGSIGIKVAVDTADETLVINYEANDF